MPFSAGVRNYQNLLANYLVKVTKYWCVTCEGQVSYPGGCEQTLSAGMGHFTLSVDFTFLRNQRVGGTVA